MEIYKYDETFIFIHHICCKFCTYMCHYSIIVKHSTRIWIIHISSIIMTVTCLMGKFKNIILQYIYFHHLFIKVRWMWYQCQKNCCFYCIVQSDMLRCCRQQSSHHHRRSHHHSCVARRSCRTHKNLMHASK